MEVKLHPYLQGKPVGVVQYNPQGCLDTVPPEQDRLTNDSNGSLIAVRCACCAARSFPALPCLARLGLHISAPAARCNIARLPPPMPCCCSYEARALGVKRNSRGDQARAACPDIQLVQVQCAPPSSPARSLVCCCCRGERPAHCTAQLCNCTTLSSTTCQHPRYPPTHTDTPRHCHRHCRCPSPTARPT